MKYTIIIIISLITFNAHSLELTLSQGTIKPTPIAVTDLFSNVTSLEKIGKNISSVISDNLERSGLFLPIDQKAFIQSSESLSTQPRFEDWKVIKAQHLVAGKIITNGDNISVEFRLFDVFAQKQLVGKKYQTSKKNWRRVAHIISDKIYERLTGEEGYFDTRIIYVAESGPKNERVKKTEVRKKKSTKKARKSKKDGAFHQYDSNGPKIVSNGPL